MVFGHSVQDEVQWGSVRRPTKPERTVWTQPDQYQHFDANCSLKLYAADTNQHSWGGWENCPSDWHRASALSSSQLGNKKLGQPLNLPSLPQESEKGRVAERDLILLLNHCGIDQHPWLIPPNKPQGTAQIAPTYNVDYQFIITNTVFWAFSHFWGDKEGGGWSALQQGTNKPPELLSQTSACGRESKCNRHYSGRFLLVTHIVHFQTKPETGN